MAGRLGQGHITELRSANLLRSAACAFWALWDEAGAGWRPGTCSVHCAVFAGTDHLGLTSGMHCQRKQLI